MKFKVLSEMWLQEKARDVKLSTIAAYRATLRNWILPHFGDMEQVSNKDAQQWVELQIVNNHLSQKTIKDTLIVLQMILKFGKREELFEYNGPFFIKYPRVNVKQQAKKADVLSKADFKKLKIHLEENFSFPNLGILIAMHTGMRIGEISGLRWSDIDFKNELLIVNRTCQRITFSNNISKLFPEEEFEKYVAIDGLEVVSPRFPKENDHSIITLTNPKSVNSNREIPLPKSLLKILKNANALIVDKEQFVITGSRSVCEPRTYRNRFYKLLEELKIPQIVFHGLRHTFATYCVEAGADIKTISLMLGHADVSTTLNIYANPDIQQKKQIINKIFK